ncbi:MAG TPA: hypothetical protein VKK31_17495 [Thermoanaerobaculia bacterium]|nr:hypothetical protein [Thermoanaerobaculia bacterium]
MTPLAAGPLFSYAYTIVASNAGPSSVTAAGSGNINDTVNLPTGSNVTYTASCTVSVSATGTLVNTATVTAPAGVTDTPGNNSATDTDTISAVPAASVSGTKTASAGPYTVGGTLTYTITLTNSGTAAQGDNPGNEFTDVLPATLTLVSASASSGTAATAANTVTWNGAIPAGGTVTITINATILPSAAGATVSNQGTISFDADGNGSNESTAQTDDPAAIGTGNPTNVQVAGGPTAPSEIPTLSSLGLMLMGLVLAALALAVMKKRQQLQ